MRVSGDLEVRLQSLLHECLWRIKGLDIEVVQVPLSVSDKNQLPIYVIELHIPDSCLFLSLQLCHSLRISVSIGLVLIPNQVVEVLHLHVVPVVQPDVLSVVHRDNSVLTLAQVVGPLQPQALLGNRVAPEVLIIGGQERGRCGKREGGGRS